MNFQNNSSIYAVLAERIYLSVNNKNVNKKESVHLESWPKSIFNIDEKKS